MYVTLDPVVQSIVSLTSSLNCQLVNCFMTLYANAQIFFVEKCREAFKRHFSRERTYVIITYVSKENNLGPGDTIRYIWDLKGSILIL